jgi:hypothetical protein
METAASNFGQSAPRWRAEARTLATVLERRGLTSSILGHGAVLARNPAGEPDPDDPRGQAFSPGLRQEVVCRPHGPDGALWWHWSWSGPTRTSPPELEPLCPAGDTEMAAERIARVLADAVRQLARRAGRFPWLGLCPPAGWTRGGWLGPSSGSFQGGRLARAGDGFVVGDGALAGGRAAGGGDRRPVPARGDHHRPAVAVEAAMTGEAHDAGHAGIAPDCPVWCLGVRTVGDLVGLLVEAGRTSGLHEAYAAATLNAPHEHERVTLSCPITCLGLSAHVVKALRWSEAATVGGVLRLLQSGELAEVPNIGPRRVGEVRTSLIAAGFSASQYAGLK